MSARNWVELKKYENDRSVVLDLDAELKGDSEKFLVVKDYDAPSGAYSKAQRFGDLDEAVITASPAMSKAKAVPKKYDVVPDWASGLKRIVACQDFACQGREVRKGDMGGLVSSEANLSQEGTCWLFDQSRAVDSSRVSGDACIEAETTISQNAQVSGDVRADGAAYITDNARASENAHIAGMSFVGGNADLSGFCNITDSATITDNTKVSGCASIEGESTLKGVAEVGGSVIVCEEAVLDEGYYVGSEVISGMGLDVTIEHDEPSR